MALYPLTTLAILLAIIVYFVLGGIVGAARAKYGVEAPASSGHPEFDKRNRVHMNTLEQLVIFVPAAMLAAPVLGDAIAGGLGLVWTVGRYAYARAYYRDPKSGLICGYVSLLKKEPLVGPRGVGIMFAFPFLVEVDDVFAREQYALAQKHLVG